jgi:putative endonuclease
MKMTRKMEIGKRGEDIAAKYLIKNGCKILERNYRIGFDEIDIIAQSGDRTLIFCEVKTFAGERLNSEYGLVPEDNLTSAKFRKISRACEMFAAGHDSLVNERMGWRIDCVIVIIGTGENHIIRYYENI